MFIGPRDREGEQQQQPAPPQPQQAAAAQQQQQQQQPELPSLDRKSAQEYFYQETNKDGSITWHCLICKPEMREMDTTLFPPQKDSSRNKGGKFESRGNGGNKIYMTDAAYDHVDGHSVLATQHGRATWLAACKRISLVIARW